jgi:hypothetical protein
VEPGLPFMMDSVTIERTPVLTLSTREGDVDLFDEVRGIGAYPDVASASQEVSVPPLRFRVLDLPALIKSKRATARPKDKDALLELEALLALRRRATPGAPPPPPRGRSLE